MKKKTIIKKIIFLAAWTVVIGGIAFLLIAANSKRPAKFCRDVVVGIRGSGERHYVENAGILQTLEEAGGVLMGKPLDEISLKDLEFHLEQDQWIKRAELYFDREDVLHVFVEEREPVARIFTHSGVSFYMDSAGHKMHLLENLNARVPVITGFPSSIRKIKRDSLFMDDVKRIATYLYTHEFWNAQTGQVDITGDRNFEIIPVIGDHIIKIGKAENFEAKLDRVLLFYKKVLAKTGFNKYSVIDARFNNQVVGVHRGLVSSVDSVQLQKNIKELLESSNIQNLTSDILPGTGSRNDAFTRNTVQTVPEPTNPTPAERFEDSKPSVMNLQNQSNPMKTSENSQGAPKAVMPRRSGK